MINKIKYRIKKALDLKFLTIKVLITNPQGESFESEIDRIPEYDSHIFALDYKLSNQHGKKLYAFFECAEFKKIEEVYHCSGFTGTWLVRILP